MKKNNTPILFILSGLPGSGKSTLSKLILEEYAAAYIRIDTIEQALRDLLNIVVHSEGYALAYKMASENLKLGQCVVADSCNPITITRQEWENIAKINGAIYINIEVLCSDKFEHQKRLETRGNEVENLMVLNWNDVISKEFDVWTEKRITIDTANKNLAQTAIELSDKIKKFLNDEKTVSLVLK